jgi:uncharacterized protein (TIGR02270 family)
VTGVIDSIVSQHAEEAGALWWQHRQSVAGPQYGMRELRRLHDRIDAHFDGLRIAGDAGFQACIRQLGYDDPGGMFSAAVLSLESRHAERIELLLAAGEASTVMYAGITSAFEWVSARCLSGIVSSLLRSTSRARRRVGLASCAAHRVNPGEPLQAALLEDDTTTRAEALRTVGELGLAGHVMPNALLDNNDECRAWAAWSSVMLGNRSVALEVLTQISRTWGPLRDLAFPVVLQSISLSSAHGMLQELATQEGQLRWLIRGSGIVGDPAYAAWLIDHMDEPGTARLAGEAFTLITGADLVRHGIDGSPPKSFQSGPSDDPDDPDVEMSVDEGLPWPNGQKVQSWWRTNEHKFQKGTRYFMGAPVTRDHCINVLKNGYQRQRILAAHYLCLLEPGTPLFNTSAPAWRQQRLLAKMG